MAQLHQGLDRGGFSVPEEEAADWFFGEGTESALNTWQVQLCPLRHVARARHCQLGQSRAWTGAASLCRKRRLQTGSLARAPRARKTPGR